jgi:DNA invertase Pin-like site-specific DNA recombinase
MAARVSSLSQSTGMQVERLRALDCRAGRKEAAFGHSRAGRSAPESPMRPGDTLAALTPDRPGRSTCGVLNPRHELESRRAARRVREPEIDTSGQDGRITLATPSRVVEMDLTRIKKRQRAGIAAAKAKGVCRGRQAVHRPRFGPAAAR